MLCGVARSLPPEDLAVVEVLHPLLAEMPVASAVVGAVVLLPKPHWRLDASRWIAVAPKDWALARECC